jgi:flagellar assembly protein FliH
MKKFLFDRNDFDDADSVNAAQTAYTEEQMALAKKQSIAQGRDEALKDLQAAQSTKIAALLDRAGTALERIIAAEERRDLETTQAAVALTLQMAKKLFSAFAGHFGQAEIERVIAQTLETRREEPRITITIPAVHAEALKSRIEDIARDKGFAGKLAVAADEALGQSDVRIEWADGGAERLYERLFAQIEAEFAKTVETMQTQLSKTDQ